MNDNSSCHICAFVKCVNGEDEKLPKFCPMEDEKLYEEAKDIIRSEKYAEFYKASSEIEKEGYCIWPRVREIMELIKKMKYKKIGLAFCNGFKKEAKMLSEIFSENGIELVSAMCKTGGIDKTEVGMTEDVKLRPGNFEAICNPVAQALILNKEKTDFNIVLGLCVGHDSLFYKFSESLCTTLVVKDRVTGHNPVAALYCKDGYFKKRLKTEE